MPTPAAFDRDIWCNYLKRCQWANGLLGIRLNYYDRLMYHLNKNILLVFIQRLIPINHHASNRILRRSAVLKSLANIQCFSFAHASASTSQFDCILQRPKRGETLCGSPGFVEMLSRIQLGTIFDARSHTAHNHFSTLLSFQLFS